MITDIDKFKALFLLAGIEVTSCHEIANKYWPKSYTQVREENPWALMMTDFGPVVIGWRKRVISIDWTDTNIRCDVTQDDVTKTDSLVHAWGYIKALEYLTSLRNHI